MHPNPNNGNFSLSQAVADMQPVTAEIWNAVGTSVFTSRLLFTNNKADIKVNGISLGSYLLKLYDSNGYQYVIKFTILQ